MDAVRPVDPLIDLTPARVPAALAGRITARAPRVAVVGDALLDGWLSGPARRLGRDGPVPVVELSETRSAPGGAGNVAVNLAALGARVELVSVLGDDADAGVLRELLQTAGVHTTPCVAEEDRATAVKRRLVSAGQPLARYDAGPDRAPRPETVTALVAGLDAVLDREPDAVLVADYGLGAVGGEVRAALARRRGQIPLLVVDARAGDGWGALAPDVITPNAAEAAALIGAAEPVGPDRAGWVLAHRDELVAAAGGGDVLVTLDVDGAVRLPADPDAPAGRTTAVPGPDSRACGAGDTFTAAATAALASGIAPETALVLAQCAADVVVAQEGTAVCSAGALTARLAARDRGGLLEHRDLLAILAEHRRTGHRIVFTNGCFDVLHRGHVAYLRQARALGDVLVVALNDDGSVARLKGPERPVNPLEDRAGVVGAIECVDLVTAFSQDTPVELIEAVRPDVYTKGGDYTPQMLPETPTVERLGGEVRVLDYLSDHSTTAIVGRIRAGRS
ncbi:D-glycero-beta-D-manno-heptose 1-phosphate adenylyltransferase [Pseudonocardia kunmingensis]|uniref:D-glycero-beta-D-manno-heptose 1-phosphate adenylyltransferase n=1 Tax=Pseudonocardia kunmingensis TaxID=630975 RepID=A0A543D1H1_9PSEU|nr:D-glycero-beta-D-manno-heptose 1-phosphate adenylyltransferase [Pseudonocardia kunmingensis]TQM03152.1 rfaE bifunctional protein kinase chain/domain/rfaE bifunctional protein nucleotidyltransferase chain/domain [Pseudonocardia kunmingensis]